MKPHASPHPQRKLGGSKGIAGEALGGNERSVKIKHPVAHLRYAKSPRTTERLLHWAEWVSIGGRQTLQSAVMRVHRGGHL